MKGTIIQIILTNEEKESIKKVAKNTGLSTSSYARMILLKSVKMEVSH